jgi:hypothetical protein
MCISLRLDIATYLAQSLPEIIRRVGNAFELLNGLMIVRHVVELDRLEEHDWGHSDYGDELCG